MSLNRFGNKTLTGEDDLEVDKINIVGQGIGINDNFGTNGQILKKSSVDNTLIWGSETDYSAVLPIVLTGTSFKFDNSDAGSNKVVIKTLDSKKSLHIGTGITLQENNSLIICDKIDSSNSYIYNSGDLRIHEGQTLKLTINKSQILPTGNDFVIGTAGKPINQIVSNTQNIKTILFVGDLSGNIITTTPTGITGNNQGNIQNFSTITLTDNISASNFISSNGNVITTHGGTLTTYAGNIDLIRVVGNNTTFGNIINCGVFSGSGYSTATGGTINNINQSTIIQQLTSNISFYNSDNNGIIGSVKIAINTAGNNNYIEGNGASNISGISTISCVNINPTGNITLNGTGSSGILTCANTPIFSTGLKQASGGGNFSITTSGTFVMAGGDFNSNIDMKNNNIVNIGSLGLSAGLTLNGDLDLDDNKIKNAVIKEPTIEGNIDMNANQIINISAIGFKSSGNGLNMNTRAIIDIGGISMTNSGDIDMNTGDILECGNIACSTITLGGTISQANIPATIGGNKSFTGNITFQGDLIGNSGDTDLTNTNISSITNKYLPSDCYEDTNGLMCKFIPPRMILNDDDKSGQTFISIDESQQAGSLVINGGSTQAYVEFMIPAQFKWVKYLVILRDQYNNIPSTGNSGIYVRPQKRNFSNTNTTDLNTTDGQGNITYPAFNTINTLTTPLLSGYTTNFNGTAPNNSNGIESIIQGQLEFFKSGKWNSTNKFKGIVVYFEYINT